MRPLAGTPESPASSPIALQRVVTEQGTKLYKNMARKETRHRKFKLSLGFGQQYLYVYTSKPLMHNSEPWNYAILKRVCYSAVQYHGLLLMECHHAVIPVPNPARPPLRIFFLPKTNKKMTKVRQI